MALEPAIRVEHLDALRNLDTCTVSDAIETFQVRLRNTGFADSRIRCMFEDLPPMVGYAATARLRSAEPPITGSYHDRSGWWNSILNLPVPRIAVLEDLDHTPGMGAFVGEMQAAILKALGCVGYVTNGAVRELPGVRETGLHLFAGNVAVACLCPYLRIWVGGPCGRTGSSNWRPAAWRSPWAADGSEKDCAGDSGGCGEIAGGSA